MSQSFFNLFDTRTLNVDPTLFPGFDSSISIISESLTSLPPSSEVFIVSCFRCKISWLGESLVPPRPRSRSRPLPP